MQRHVFIIFAALGCLQVDGRTIKRDVEICNEAEVSLLGSYYSFSSPCLSPYLYFALYSCCPYCTEVYLSSGWLCCCRKSAASSRSVASPLCGIKAARHWLYVHLKWRSAFFKELVAAATRCRRVAAKWPHKGNSKCPKGSSRQSTAQQRKQRIRRRRKQQQHCSRHWK